MMKLHNMLFIKLYFLTLTALLTLMTGVAFGADQLSREPSALVLSGGGISGGYIQYAPPYDGYTADNVAPAPYDTYGFCIYSSETEECVDTFWQTEQTISLRHKDICKGCSSVPCNYVMRTRWKNSTTGEVSELSPGGRDIICQDGPVVLDTTNRVTTTSSSSTSSTVESTTTTTTDGSTTITTTTAETTSSTSSTSTTAAVILDPPPIAPGTYVSWDAVIENCGTGCTYEYLTHAAGALTWTPTELVTNGTFTTNLDGWTAGDGWSQSDGTAAYSGTGAGTLSQAATIIAGHTYIVRFTSAGLADSDNFTLTLGGVESGEVTANYTYTWEIQASTTGGLIFTPAADSGAFTLDSVSVYDDSTKAGTLTGNPLKETPLTVSDTLGSLCTEVGYVTDGRIWVRAVNSSGFKSEWISMVLSCDAASQTTTSSSTTTTASASSTTSSSSPSTTTTTNDVFDETFTGEGYATTWTEYMTGGNSVLDEDHAITGGVDDDEEGLRAKAEAGYYSYARKTQAVARNTATNIYFTFMINAVSFPADWGTVRVLTLDTDTGILTYTGNPVAWVELVRYNSTYRLRGRGATSGSGTTATELSTGTWYTGHLYLDAAAATNGSYLTIDGGSQLTFTRNDTADTAYIMAGIAQTLATSYNADIEFGYIRIVQ